MKKKIKVLQVIPKLGYGGAETGCYDLAHFLPEQDCKSYIATSGGDLLKYIKKNKVKIFRLPVHSKNPILILINAIIIFFIIGSGLHFFSTSFFDTDLNFTVSPGVNRHGLDSFCLLKSFVGVLPIIFQPPGLS